MEWLLGGHRIIGPGPARAYFCAIAWWSRRRSAETAGQSIHPGPAGPRLCARAAAGVGPILAPAEAPGCWGQQQARCVAWHGAGGRMCLWASRESDAGPGCHQLSRPGCQKLFPDILPWGKGQKKASFGKIGLSEGYFPRLQGLQDAIPPGSAKGRRPAHSQNFELQNCEFAELCRLRWLRQPFAQSQSIGKCARHSQNPSMCAQNGSNKTFCLFQHGGGGICSLKVEQLS